MKASKISMDKFRIIAAILIIAIHIFPFASINETLDFVFTHVICRIGVPFFFMITGYFVLPKAIEDKRKLIKYTLKIVKIYAICILIYLPINIYARQLQNLTILEIIKNICINGTFYHLWYFPAIILGIWVTYFLVKHLNKTLSLISITILYIIGVFGDSYFGISKQITIISKIYDAIFMIADYTRNGLFFAPIFISLGYSFNNMKNKISQNKSAIFTIIFTFFMIFEGIILKHFNLQKHDSMYFMLVPTMFFIFNILVQINNENNKKLRNIATIIYIIHPMFIIFIRGVAKIIGLENIMINNSVINYILVVTSTIIFSIIFETIKEIILNRKNTKIEKIM